MNHDVGLRSICTPGTHEQPLFSILAACLTNIVNAIAPEYDYASKGPL